MKVDMSDAVSSIKRIRTDRAFGLFLAQEAMKGMDAYVPFRDGALSKSAKAEPFEVTYDTPYAKKVYEGQNMTISQERHPKATSRWDEHYDRAHHDELVRAAQRYIDKEFK